ncbi:MAG: ABC transporter ATP-binding protein [Oscillospiraceae bacterium]|nr:ABC transporter ATP-binding protein [Oscillospiraceae bacterium]
MRKMSQLECVDLVKAYGGKIALDHVNLQVPKGKIVGLLGPNGSGKTTLIKLANGLLTPNSGQILVDGKKPGKDTKAIVSYLPERTYFADWMSVEQTLRYFSDFYEDFDRTRAEQMLHQLGIENKMKIRQMSKGTREKLQLILVMSRDAQLFLLDEPIGGVDPATRDYILHTILANYNPNATIIISTHLIADVEQILDEVVFIHNGKIIEHTSVDRIREEKGMSVDAYFREVFKCSENW